MADKFTVQMTRRIEVVLDEEMYCDVQEFIDTELPITDDDVRDWLLHNEEASIEMMEEVGTVLYTDWKVSK